MTTIACYGFAPNSLRFSGPMRIATLFAALALVFGVAVTACGCGPAKSPSVSAKALARGAVETLSAAWIVGADGCRSIAVQKNDPVLAKTCASTFLPARASLLTAAAAVDAWTDADTSNTPCALADVILAFEKADSLLVTLGVQVPPAVMQGLELAGSLSPACVRPDAGLSDGGAE